jgi:fermentation-respiration switch protein FrsA (DUF1100 family)
MELLSFRGAALAAALVAATVAIHSAGSFSLVWAFRKDRSWIPGKPGYGQLILGLTGVFLALLFLHLLECALWAVFYYAAGCFDNAHDAIYFSLITYATVGYGDLVLDKAWRLYGGIEALTGILMLSWSTAILIAFVQWVYGRLHDLWQVGSGE